MIRIPLLAFICVVTLSFVQLSLSQCLFTDVSTKDYCLQFPSSVPAATYDKISDLRADFAHVDFGAINNLSPPFSIYVNVLWGHSSEVTTASLSTLSGILNLYSLGNPSSDPFAADKSGSGGYQDIVELYLNSGKLCLNYFVKSYSTSTSTYCSDPSSSFTINTNQWYTVGAFFSLSSSGSLSVALQAYHYDGTDSYYHSDTFALPTPLPSGGLRHVLLGLPALDMVTTAPPFFDEFRALRVQHVEADFELFDTFFTRPTEYIAQCQNLIVWYAFNDFGDGSAPYLTATGPNIPVVGHLGVGAQDQLGNTYTNSLASLKNSGTFQISPTPNDPNLSTKRSYRFDKKKREVTGYNDCSCWGDPHCTVFRNAALFQYGYVGNVASTSSVKTTYGNPSCKMDGAYLWASCTAIGFKSYVGTYHSDWDYTVAGFVSIVYGTSVSDEFNVYVGNCNPSGGNYATINGVKITTSGTGGSGARYGWNSNVFTVTGTGLKMTVTSQGKYLDLVTSYSSPCSADVHDGGVCDGVVNKIQGCQYGSWSTCSGSCTANNVPPTQKAYLTVGDNSCATSKVQYCNNVACPCYFNDWSSCSTTCNYGTQTRTLQIASSGGSCDRSQSKSCMLQECGCYYTDWSDCSKHCNTGYQTRNLIVNAPSGYSCASQQTQTCNTQACPACKWQNANPSCSPVCGTGATKYYYAQADEKEWCTDFTVPCNVSCDTNECNTVNSCDTASTTCENVVCGDPSCFNYPTYNCNCKAGYERTYSDFFDGWVDDYSCSDINECADASLNDCDPDATCYNTPGSYYCVCNTDYIDTSADLDGTSCYPNCNQTEWSDCVGYCDGIGVSTRTVVANLLTESRCAPLSKECNMSACAPIPAVTCDLSALGTDYETQALAACSCVDADSYPDLYTTCLLDVCWGQDLTIAASHCTVSQEECLKDLLQTLSLDPTATVDVTSCPQVCINTCNGHGTCNTSIGCICNSGWTGIDCRFPTTYHCNFTATWNSIERPIAGYREDMGTVMDADEVETYFTDDSKQVVDSILIYFLESLTDGLTYTPVHHLMVINDNSDADTDGGSYTLDVSVTSGDFSDVTVYTGEGVTLNPDWKSVDFAWSSYTTPRAGLYVTDLPDTFCIDISVTNVGTGVTQLLFGTGTGGMTSSAFEVMKVPSLTSTSYETITVCSTACTDSCSSYTNCADCTDDTACGWCRDTGECQAGRATGPVRGECENWRYSFENSVSRRLTLDLNYPIHYDDVEVYLSDEPVDAASLPQQLSIDVVSPTGIIWDVLFVVPENRPTFVSSIYSKVSEIITKLRDFTELDISVVSFYDSDADVHKVLTSSWQRISDFQDIVDAIASGTSDSTAPNVPAILEVLAGSTLDFGWRTNARKAVLFFADVAYTQTDSTFSDQKLAILAGGYYPIFIVDPTVVDNYNTLVKDLEFGSVITYSATTVGSSASAALSLASSTVSLIIADAGHIDESQKEDTYITGLSEGMRARFTYVFKSSEGSIDTSTLIAPGFGTATVESVETDKPTCGDVEITVQEDSIDQTVGERAVLITLNGYTYKNYPMYFKVQVLPSEGKLYQWTDSDTFENYEITAAGTTVYDSGSRLVYIPPQYAQSVNNAPYITFEYGNNDLCADSANCEISIYFTPVPNPPVADNFNITTLEDTPACYSISSYKFDHDLTDPDGAEQNTTWAVQSNTRDILRWNTDGVDGSNIIWTDDYTSETTFCSVTPLNSNGYFEFDWMAQDTTSLYSNPATITLYVTPVNDPPTVSAGTPASGKMNTWYSISITSADVDSAVFSLVITLPASFKGYLVDNATNETVSSGEEWTTTGPAETPRSALVQLAFRGIYDDYSCDIINGVDKNCTVDNNLYTYFTVQAIDGEGATSDNLTINLIVVNTDAAPTVAYHNGSIYMTEDVNYTDTYAGQDVDTSSIESFIVTLPDGLTTYQYPASDGQTVSSSGLITDSEDRVVLAPPSNVFGDPNNSFYYSYLTYKIYDGLFYSDIQQVTIYLIPVNDPPVPGTSSFSTNEDTPLVIALFATDVDNTLTELTFTLTSIPDSDTVGTFYQYDSSADSYVGTEITSDNTVVPVQSCTTYSGQVLTAACLVFTPATLTYGESTFNFTVTDVDTYGTSHVNVVPKTADLAVLQVNHAPVAEMSSPSIYEDTYTTITLGYWDREDDAVAYTITSVPSEGTVYQYSSAVAGGDATDAVAIDTTNGEINVTDSQGRIVYIPPTNKNSETSIAYLFYKPSFSYFVSETDPEVAPPMGSSEITVTIFIYEVNDAPYVWGDVSYEDDWTVTGSGICYSNCTFEEDFGTEYPLTVGTRKISLGGYDIEWDSLTVYIESISCPDSPNTEFWDVNSGDQITTAGALDDTLTITGDSTTGYPTLKILISFTPFLDQNDFTCTINYKVFDGELYSVNSKTISIFISPVNDPPRLYADDSTTIWTIENEDVSFTPDLYDVENNVFTASVIAFSTTSGVFKDYLGNNLTEGQTLSGDSTDTTKWKITYSPATDENGSPLNSITLQFDDGQSWDPITTVTYYVNVYAVNQAPTFTIVDRSVTLDSNFDLSTVDPTEITGPTSLVAYSIEDYGTSSADPISLWSYILVADVDAGSRSVECNISASSGTFSITIGADVIYTSDSDNSFYSIKTSTDSLTTILNTLTWTAPDGGVDDANVTIIVDDLGWSGYCEPNATTGIQSTAVCPKTAVINVTLSSGELADIQGLVAISSGSAAAGAILIGLLGALLFRRLSDEASSAEFQPWDDASFGNVANVNPLFESAEIGGSSPIYEAANNADYVAMSN